MRFPGICSIALITGTMGLAQQHTEIAGDYVEVRSNRVFGCYCEWSGEAVTSGKEAIMAWNIQAGSFRGIHLSGVKIVAVVVAQTTLSQGLAPRRSVLFIDNSASKEPRQGHNLVSIELSCCFAAGISGRLLEPLRDCR